MVTLKELINVIDGADFVSIFVDKNACVAVLDLKELKTAYEYFDYFVVNIKLVASKNNYYGLRIYLNKKAEMYEC